ncbi:SusC/RagA family TonB-linked outer membrane protein [Mucilaginibacter pedocola]|uniref:SusC/RagA family TonB-linked outer membrane protein n=1 Tax=Mucilaginibacter pedocola TaxID=1792845 RepID=A0A1S9P9R1_9SPHI|nr:TonB-dependent receptor [Mucilaginibacter pedocola]OOQ57692.1 SusC/RagA family TonB-linked outer membrane protein [Mucilaginibacter pedocola]
MKKILLSFLLLFVTASLAFSQNSVITGKVTDQKDGSALPGVTVTVKGTPGIGTQTDVNGKYSLSVPAGKVLVFKFIGYKAVELAANSSVVDATLETDSKQLTEVVVVGYGTQKRQNITGSVASIAAKEIENTPVTTLEQAIQGKAAGVVIQSNNGKLGQGIKISVRGTSSISAGTQPLIVLDGIILNQGDISSTNAATNPLADINFNDFESVEILKDASASAIYGARASNGVILLTSKKGKAGKAKLNFSSQFGSSKPSRHRQFLNSEQYLQIERRAGVGASLQDFNNGFYDTYQDALDDNAAFVESRLLRYSAGVADVGAANVDWEKQAFQDAPQAIYDLNLSGGNDKTTYLISGQYSDQKGILVGNRFKKYSGRVNLSTKPFSRVEVGMNLNFTNTVNNRISDDNQFSTPMQIVALSPITPIIDPRTGLLSGSLPGSASNYPVYYNPLLSVANSYYNTTVFRTIGNVYGSWEIVKHLTLRSEFGLDQTNQNEDSYYGRLTFRNTGTPNGAGQNTNNGIIHYTVNNYINYKNVFNTDHSLDVTAGTSYEYNHFVGNDIQGQQFPSDAYKQIASAAVKSGGSSSQSEYAFVSYFSRANYAYKGKYLLSASARTDASSRFGKNSRYGFFPAASVGWILSEESFLKNSTFISNLKLKAGYGLTGNAEVGNYPALGLFSGDAGYNGSAGQRFIQIANPNLKWETTGQFDVGVNFGFFNNRISGGFEYYRKNTRDLLLDVNIPGTLGLSIQTQNLGKLYNQGYELELSGDIFVGKFKWTSSFNGAFNKNVVTDIKKQVLGSNDLNRVIEGQPIGVFYGKEYAGVDPANGDAIYYLNTKDANGNFIRTTTNDYNAAQNVILGNPTPKYTAGWTNTFAYAGFDLSVTMQGSWGNKIYNGGGQYMSASASNGFDNQTVDQMAYWDKPGDITDVPEPRLFYGNGVNASSRYLSSGSYIRMKTVGLGYSIPKSLLAKIKLANARVFMNAYNLFLITKYKGWDPEVNADYQASNINLGVDFYSAPQPRTITFGVNIGL